MANEAEAHNSQRSLGEKLLRSNKLDKDDVMRAEAKADDAEYDATHPEVPTIEFETENIQTGKKETSRIALPRDLEAAQDKALHLVLDAEWGAGNAAQIVTPGAKIRMPDGSLIPWHEFTDPALARANKVA